MASSLVSPITTTILSGAALSASFPNSGEGVLSVSTDTHYPGASMKFNVAITPDPADPNNPTADLQRMQKGDGSGDYTLTISASKTMPINPGDFAGYSRIQVVAASNASADSVVTFGVRSV